MHNVKVELHFVLVMYPIANKIIEKDENLKDNLVVCTACIWFWYLISSGWACVILDSQSARLNYLGS